MMRVMMMIMMMKMMMMMAEWATQHTNIPASRTAVDEEISPNNPADEAAVVAGCYMLQVMGVRVCVNTTVCKLRSPNGPADGTAVIEGIGVDSKTHKQN